MITSDKHQEQPHPPIPSAAQAEEKVQQLAASSEAVEQKPVLQSDEGSNSGDSTTLSKTEQTKVVMEKENSPLPSQPDISCAPTVPSVSIGERRYNNLLGNPVQTRCALVP